MKLWKKGFLTLAAALLLLTVLTGAALAADSTTIPGGARPVISVQLNGEMVPFTDAVPQVVDQRTFLPVRAVLEAMGAQVDYDAETSTITAQRDGVTVTMKLGETQAAVTENGKTYTLEMDAAPYTKDNRTYVPVRFAAEAFGCSVGWDQRNQTVIIVDVDALFGNATFDLMDRFAAYCTKQESLKSMEVAGNLILDIADKSGQLAQPVHATGTLTGLADNKGAQLKMSADLSDLTALLPDNATRLVLAPFLSDLNVEIRSDAKMLYLNGTLIALLVGGQDANAWYSMDISEYGASLLEGMDLSSLTQLEDASVGEALMNIAKEFPLESTGSYDSVAQVVSIYVDLFSDQAFVKKGNTYVSTSTVADMLTMTISLTENGEDITAMDLTMSADEAENTLTMTAHIAPDNVAMEMDMEIKDDSLEAAFHLDLSCLPTDKAPETAPPAGAQVIPMN